MVRLLQTLRMRIRRQICPYCFEPYRLKDTPFRCVSPASRCAPERDEVRAEVWEDNAPLGRVLPATGRLQREVSCPACSQASRKRLCPRCHMELPRTSGEFPNLIVAVIGAKEAGKSHYIAVLLERIRKQVGPTIDLLLEPLDDHTIRRYREDFYEPVFRRGVVITTTKSAVIDRRVQLPLVYTLTFGGKNLFGRRAIRAVVNLVFFDTAGEDLDSRDTMATVNKYIYRADGIILLLDPLQLELVRARLDGGTKLPDVNTETATIIERTTELIRAGQGLSSDARIPTPLAVAFSKFDALDPLVDPQLQLNASSNHEEGFDLADFEAVSAELQSLLEDWDGRLIQQQVEIHFKRYGFFGLSALGCNPHGDQTIPHVLPRRVEDPFLWLLHCQRLIPSRRN